MITSSSTFTFHLKSNHIPPSSTIQHHKMATTTLLNQDHHFKPPLTITVPPPQSSSCDQENQLPLYKKNPSDLCHIRKLDLIDRLAETSADIIDSIWQHQRYDPFKVKVVCTKGFIYEILKRSKTTYSNLQVCLFYLFRIKHVVLLHMANHHHHQQQQQQQQSIKNKRDHDMICCGRRMFLASLMVASKYLQDKNYRNRAWSRISGLSLNEINAAEFTFLKLINYNLYISKDTFDQWYTLLHTYLQKPKLPLPYYYTMLPSPLSPTFHHPYLHSFLSSTPSSSSTLLSPISLSSSHSPSIPFSNTSYPSPPYDPSQSHPSYSNHKKRSLDHSDQGASPKKRYTST
ncbi:unnamed protein product [Cunninghamella blakesleeana]